MRIVTLLPSATEIVCALGLRDSLVGVSHECDFPASVRELPSVTRSAIPAGLPSGEIDAIVREQLTSEKALYHLDERLMAELKPDLIVTQALCDVCAVAASEVEATACSLPGNPAIINLEPMTLEEVFDTITMVGEHTSQQREAHKVLSQYRARVEAVQERTANLPRQQRKTLAFLEWLEPFFNGGHWTPELIEMAGGIDCFDGAGKASTTVADSALIDAQPDVFFVAQCGFMEERTAQDLPRLATIPGWESLPCVRSGELYYTDGNAYFSRPGPRLVESLELIAHTLYPQIHPLPTHIKPALKFGP